MKTRTVADFFRPRNTSRSVLAAAILAVGLVALPLFFLVVRASQTGFQKVCSLIFSAHVESLLSNTVALAVSATVLCAVLGVGAAWLVECTELPGRRAWGILLALPVAVPDFVVGWGWTSFFPSFHGFPAALTIMSLSLYPLVYLPVAASFRNFDPLLREVGQSLGLGPFQVFFRVVFPQIRRALRGGCLLVVLGLLAEYGAFEIVRFQTFTTAIFTEFTLGFDTPGASAESLVLVVLGILALIGEQRGAGSESALRSGSGTRRPPFRVSLKSFKFPAVLLLITLLILALGVPFYSIGYWIFQGNSSTLPPSSLLDATLNTVLYSTGAAALSTLLSLPVALFAVRSRGVLGLVLEKTAFLPQAVPGVVVGLSLVFFAIKTAPFLYQTGGLLVLGYSMMFFPLALVGVRASASQVSQKWEESALSLGVRRFSTFWKVTLPNLLPGLKAAFILVSLSASTELTATLLLHPTGTQTLATRFWAYTAEVSYGAAAPYAALIVTISVAPAFFLGRSLGNRSRRDS